MRRKSVMLFLIGMMVAATSNLFAQCDDDGLLIRTGWALDYNKAIGGFNPSRAEVSMDYCWGIGFLGANAQFLSKADDSFRIYVKGGVTVNVSSFLLFQLYGMGGYTHYRNNGDVEKLMPEYSLGYGVTVNVAAFHNVGFYVDIHKCHYLDEKYIPQKYGPFCVGLGGMVVLR